MRAEVISIGDELTSGQRLDTNSQWLSLRLADLGIRTLFHTTVADDLDANRHAFRQAAERVDLVVCTGGLGPTADDLTRQAIAEAFDLPLEQDDAALQHIRQLFTSRNRTMPEANQVQAYFPRSSQVVPNPHGTAPGIDLQLTAPYAPCRIFALPGVPAEMREMWDQTVQPRLTDQLGDDRRVVYHRRLKCFGMGESAVEAKLPDLIRRGRTPSVGITVSQATITLRVTARAETVEACQQIISPTLETIRECLGQLVFGEEDDELQHVIARQLARRQQTLALAEWGTGGLISQWLAHTPESTSIFSGGQILSGQQPAWLNSAEIRADAPAQRIREIAQAVRQRVGADYGLAIGPLPNDPANTSASSNVAVPICLSGPGGTQEMVADFMGHPDIRLPLVAKRALNMLRLHLDGSQ